MLWLWLSGFFIGMAVGTPLGAWLWWKLTCQSSPVIDNGMPSCPMCRSELPWLKVRS